MLSSASKAADVSGDPAQTAELLKSAAKNSHCVDKCLYKPLTVSISRSFNCTKAFEKKLRAIDGAVLKTVQGLNPVEYQVLNSVPGIGKVYASGILAEIDSLTSLSGEISAWQSDRNQKQ